MIRQFGTSDLLYLILATRWTLLLFGIAALGGSILGIVLVLMRLSPHAWIRWVAAGYTRVIQGTPLLIQLFLAFFLPSVWGARPDPMLAAAMALSINASAFLGEAWRGCVQSIPKGQWEAAQALGLTRIRILHLVIFPQAIRVGIPPTVGFLVQMIKATALASIIGFVDLTRAGQLLTNATAEPGLIYLIVTVIYFCLCWPVSVLSRRLEARLAQGG